MIYFAVQQKWTQQSDFPNGSVKKTPGSRCRRPRFDTWSGNYILPASTKTQHSQLNKYFKKKKSATLWSSYTPIRKKNLKDYKKEGRGSIPAVEPA